MSEITLFYGSVNNTPALAPQMPSEKESEAFIELTYLKSKHIT